MKLSLQNFLYLEVLENLPLGVLLDVIHPNYLSEFLQYFKTPRSYLSNLIVQMRNQQQSNVVVVRIHLLRLL